jgi:hypothetical protein
MFRRSSWKQDGLPKYWVRVDGGVASVYRCVAPERPLEFWNGCGSERRWMESAEFRSLADLPKVWARYDGSPMRAVMPVQAGREMIRQCRALRNF